MLSVDLMTFSSDNCQLYSTIEYPHLTTLDMCCAHGEYVEQFLNETKTYMPCLTELLAKVRDLSSCNKALYKKRNATQLCQSENIIYATSIIIFRRFL